MAYVIKSWKAGGTPLDQEGSLVHITGREAGLIAWVLSLVGIDPTINFRVTSENIVVEQGSLRGSVRSVIPLRRVCSTEYGYTKPWQEALVLTVVLAPLILIGFVVGPLYYYLNKTLSVRFVEISGVARGFDFKRSVIEGVNIDEAQAGYVSTIIQHLAAQKSG